MKRRSLVAVVLGVVFAATRTFAQDAPPPTRLTLHPQAPRAAIRRPLLPEFADRIPGNAAVYYGKVKAEQNAFFRQANIFDDVERWQIAPLEALRREQPKIGLSDYYLEQGALCDDCDWQLPLRREPGASILLSEVQETRMFARILAAKARVSLAGGDLEAALQRLRWTYALGRHVAKGETLVNGLVGLAICRIASRQLLEFVQQPDAPNLYWSLTELPRPFIDFRDAVEVELSFIVTAIPELRRPEQAGRTDEQWRDTIRKLRSVFRQLADDPDLPVPFERLLEASPANEAAARRRLLAGGWREEEFDGMLAPQIILLEAMTQYHEQCSAAVDAFASPFPEALRGFDALQADLLAPSEEPSPAAPLALAHVSALYRCRIVQANVERELAVLRLLEALRAHAAKHGLLPQSLSDVAVLDVPDDPATGQPFEYRLNGSIAELNASALPTLQDSALHYEIALATDVP